MNRRRVVKLAGFITSGWVDAWTSTPSVYAITARTAADVAAAVAFARENNFRLVIKGGGRSYQGTSNAPDSLGSEEWSDDGFVRVSGR